MGGEKWSRQFRRESGPAGWTIQGAKLSSPPVLWGILMVDKNRAPRWKPGGGVPCNIKKEIRPTKSTQHSAGWGSSLRIAGGIARRENE